MSKVRRVAVVEAGGNLGKAIVTALLDKQCFKVTAVSRLSSETSLPAQIEVRKGDYDNSSFLVDSVTGQDAVVITLSALAPPDAQTTLIDGAIEAGVKWILPNEYGSDDANARMGGSLAILSKKRGYIDQIAHSSSSHWIGVVCGCWYDYSMKLGAWGIDIKKRPAELYDEGTAKCSTSTLAQTGRMVANILDLPVTPLKCYEDKYVYARSFDLSQRDMLLAVQQATDSSDAEWRVTSRPTEEAIAEGMERVEKGERRGMVSVLYGLQFAEDAHGNFSDVACNEALGLELEDVGAVTRKMVQDLKLEQGQ